MLHQHLKPLTEMDVRKLSSKTRLKFPIPIHQDRPRTPRRKLIIDEELEKWNPLKLPLLSKCDITWCHPPLMNPCCSIIAKFCCSSLRNTRDTVCYPGRCSNNWWGHCCWLCRWFRTLVRQLPRFDNKCCNHSMNPPGPLQISLTLMP